MLSNNGHDERWQYSGGQSGDNNGTEWQIVNWYDYPWNVVLRYPDAKVRNWMGDQARAAANNNHIGYDQSERQTFWNELQKSGYDASKITTNCEADCSSGVLAIAKAAGYHFDIQKLKDINQNGYTGNEEAILSSAGFRVLRDRKYLTSDKYLDNGDILLNTQNHTAFNITRGSQCDADSIIIPSTDLLVIDVSEAQGRIDWTKVKKHISGAIIRVGYGDDDLDQDDDWWTFNASECERLGIPYGVYIYSYAGSTAQVQSEINHVLRLISGHNPKMGVFLDLERDEYGYLAQTSSEMFCRQISSKGYSPGIYCGVYYYASYLQGMYGKLDAMWWIPSYPPEINDNGSLQMRYKPNPGFDYQAWQYTCHGHVDGINTDVDLNQWYVPIDGVKPTPTQKTPHITYEIRNQFGYVKSGKDGAEISLNNSAFTAIKIGVDIGRVTYRAHCNGMWLPEVWGNDWNDYDDGYAGDDVHPIDAIQIYYTSDTSQTELYEAVYSVKPFYCDWLPEVYDTNFENTDGDETAGLFGYNIESVKIKLEKC